MSGNRRGGLGRGLGSLIPTAPVVIPTHDRSAEAELSAADDDAVGTTGSPPAQSTDATAAVDDGTPAAVAASAEVRGTASEPRAAAGELRADAIDGADDEPRPALVEVPGATFAELPVSEIHPNARQPRQAFDEDALAELTHSVREFGVLQPVIVRAHGDGYELVMGERRLRAATAAGLDTIPALIRTTTDDAMLRDALLENIHRSQLNPLEEAAAYQQLLEEFGTTHDELAHRLGRSRPQVSNTIRLLNLPVPVQRRVAAGVLSAGHARALLSLDDADDQDELAARIVAEGLSVRATEELVSLQRSAPVKPAKRAVPRRITAPAAAELAGRLSDILDTHVRVDLGRRKGRITVEFASIDDLERIVRIMAPQLATRRDDASHDGVDAESDINADTDEDVTER